jgi:hypothetical protein
MFHGSGYFCKIGLPTTEKEKGKFIWPKGLGQVFGDQKKTLTTGPYLAYLGFTKTTYIILEASKAAIAVRCHCIRMELNIL